MNKDIKKIQDKLMSNLERLDTENEDIEKEVSRSNAIAQLANTYIKTFNLIIRVEESKSNIRDKIGEVVESEE